MTDSGQARFVIEHLFDGTPASEAERTTVLLRWDETDLVVEVDAPMHGDPPPNDPAGRLDGLWEYEVVELFLLGRDDRYLEIELGPHGHYLVLRLAGERVVEDDTAQIAFRVAHHDGRWTGVAQLPRSLVPPGVERANAYAIHGRDEGRRYLAWTPVGGPEPDFHRLCRFAALPMAPATENG